MLDHTLTHDGSWTWIEFHGGAVQTVINSEAIRGKLKEKGFRFSKKRQAWYAMCLMGQPTEPRIEEPDPTFSKQVFGTAANELLSRAAAIVPEMSGIDEPAIVPAPVSESCPIAPPDMSGAIAKPLPKGIQNMIARLVAKCNNDRLNHVSVKDGRAYASDGVVMYSYPTDEQNRGKFPFDNPILDERKLSTLVTVSRYHFEKAARISYAIGKSLSNNDIDLSVNGNMYLSSKSEEVGQTTTEIKHGDGWMKKGMRDRLPAIYQKTGKDVDIRVNGKFLLDVIRFLDADQITIGLQGDASPLRFYAPNGRTALVMPMYKE